MSSSKLSRWTSRSGTLTRGFGLTFAYSLGVPNKVTGNFKLDSAIGQVVQRLQYHPVNFGNRRFTRARITQKHSVQRKVVNWYSDLHVFHLEFATFTRPPVNVYIAPFCSACVASGSCGWYLPASSLKKVPAMSSPCLSKITIFIILQRTTTSLVSWYFTM